MDSMNLWPIEQAKISCAKMWFNEISIRNIKYHDVDDYQNLLSVMKSIEFLYSFKSEINHN